MRKLKSDTVSPAESRAKYPTLMDLAKEGRSLFTHLGAAVLATGVGACSGSSLTSPDRTDAGAPDRPAIIEPDTRTYPDGVPFIGPDAGPDVAPDVGRDAFEVGQPELGFIIDGGPAVSNDLKIDHVAAAPDLGRDVIEVGLPDRPMIIDGVPAIDMGWPRDVREAAPDRQDVDTTGIDTGAELDAK